MRMASVDAATTVIPAMTASTAPPVCGKRLREAPEVVLGSMVQAFVNGDRQGLRGPSPAAMATAMTVGRSTMSS